MSKIIRLTESDLHRIVKKVIKEQLKGMDPGVEFKTLELPRPKIQGITPLSQKNQDILKNIHSTEKKRFRDGQYKAEEQKIRNHQIKIGDKMSNIFSSTDMGGIKKIDENKSIINLPTSGQLNILTIVKSFGYSVDSGEIKSVLDDREFPRLLDIYDVFRYRDLEWLTKTFENKVGNREATKKGDVYTFKSKDKKNTITVMPTYSYYLSGYKPVRIVNINVDSSGNIQDNNFVKLFNKRLPSPRQ